jgi:hypothetical protein
MIRGSLSRMASAWPEAHPGGRRYVRSVAVGVWRPGFLSTDPDTNHALLVSVKGGRLLVHEVAVVVQCVFPNEIKANRDIFLTCQPVLNEPLWREGEMLRTSLSGMPFLRLLEEWFMTFLENLPTLPPSEQVLIETPSRQARVISFSFSRGTGTAMTPRGVIALVRWYWIHQRDEERLRYLIPGEFVTYTAIQDIPHQTKRVRGTVEAHCELVGVHPAR